MRQARLLERVTFGATPALVDDVVRLGARGFLEQQLSLAPAGTSGVLTGPTILDATPPELEVLLDGVNRDRRIPHELRHAAVVRAATHPGQLAELMVDFWSNHLSTYSGTDDKNVKYAAPLDDRDVIRRHAMGRVAELVLASARSVSMQLYLDNFRSNATSPNQNYARELLELHTVGAGGGYDEGDVDQVSRILSGWGLQGNIGRFEETRFAFDPRRHDPSPLSVSITGPDGRPQVWSTPGRSGPEAEQDGIDFIDWLTHLPNTARFVCRKLARRFVGDDVSEQLVASMADVYLANDTRIVPVLRHMLTSREFESSRRTKVKTPFELLVGMIRATGATVDREAGGAATTTIGTLLTDLGHDKWSWPTPDGIPDDPNHWITTSTVLRRWELAGRLANGRLDGIGFDPLSLVPSPVPDTVGALVRALAERLGTGVDDAAISAISTYLGAPHDAPTSAIRVDRVAGDLIALLLSVPAYQYR
ncbi:DUF1800 domain-containing protein [Actinomarinicola tropica]|uniref:DUF1800 family protein n=1 Tax=Actinomarinicola tropica TaxID=2789776 RepID=A0A5Q2RLT5_9ACTN|nr:DUF1800 domain-containing protein [Actinomarinicola tropica]QGG94820.1 DUF1800 family protein [Actinomarinicola tropica]